MLRALPRLRELVHLAVHAHGLRYVLATGRLRVEVLGAATVAGGHGGGEHGVQEREAGAADAAVLVHASMNGPYTMDG